GYGCHYSRRRARDPADLRRGPDEGEGRDGALQCSSGTTGARRSLRGGDEWAQRCAHRVLVEVESQPAGCRVRRIGVDGKVVQYLGALDADPEIRRGLLSRGPEEEQPAHGTPGQGLASGCRVSVFCRRPGGLALSAQLTAQEKLLLLRR